MKRDKLLIAVLVLSLVGAVFTLFQRFQVEEPYYRVELVADYEKYKELADSMGMTMEDVLTDLKIAGVTSVAIKEETLEKLRADGLISVMNLWELFEQDLLGHPLNAVASSIKDSDLDPSGTVVIFAVDSATYKRIRAPLEARGKAFRDWSTGDTYAITVSGKYEELKELALVFDYDKFQKARELGLNVAARPSNYRGITDDYIENLFKGFKKYPVTSIIFDGKQCLGYPHKLETTARMIKETGLVLGPIESWMQLKHINQLGLDNLVKLADFKAVRVFSLDKAEAEKITPREIMDRWFRAVDERNIRIVYLNPKIETEKYPEENFKTNKEYIDEFARLISQRGFERDAVVPMKNFHIGSLRLLILVSGVVAGAAVLVDDLTRLKKKYIYGFFVLALVGCFMLQLVIPSMADKVFALGAAIVFPSLSMQYVLRYCEKTLRDNYRRDWKDTARDGVFLLLRASLISLVGAVYIGSMLSPTRYLLEIDIFRGVKIAHIVPLLIFTLAYFIIIGHRRNEHQSPREEIRSLLDTPIIVKYAILLGLAAIAGYLYLGRTGHTAGVPVLGIEARIRTFMEQTLVARPRIKEFLVAHPALIMMAAATIAKYDKLILPIGLAATIGQVSMVNSFSHLRTPLYISFYRTLYGLGFGMVLGVVAVLLSGYMIRIFKAHGRT